MQKVLFLSMLAVGFVAAEDPRTAVDSVTKTLGSPKTIQYSGSGAVFTLGQNLSPAKPWPRVEVKSFTRVIDYENLAWRQEAVGPQGPVPLQFLRGDKAWGQSGSNVTPSAPAVAVDRQLQIWMTPHGFLKGALGGNTSVKSAKIAGRQVARVSYIAQGKYRLTGTISGDHFVEKIESTLDNPVLGDMRVETVFSDYRDFSGVKFPARILQYQGGFPLFDLTVTAAQVNVPVSINVPDAVRQATPPAVQVASQKLADGVWYLTGGSHHSVAVEFQNHVAVIEAPLNEERSTAVITEVKKLIPNKPIRYLINTHHHFDHSGGLRTYVAEGATIITHQINQPFYQKTLRAPHTLVPDRQSREKRKPKLLAVGARHILADRTRTLEIHHIQGSPHNDGILMAFLPKEKLLVEVDVYTPLAPNAPPPATPTPATVNLFENLERLKLEVNPIAPLHGRLVTLGDLRKTIGK